MNTFLRLWNGLFGTLGDSSRQLGVFVDELDRHVRDLHGAVRHALAEAKRLDARTADHLAEAAAWRTRAAEALERDDPTLAREALLQSARCEAQALTLQRSRDMLRGGTRRLRAALRAEKDRVEDAKLRYGRRPAQHQSPLARIGDLSDLLLRIEADTETEEPA